MRVYKQLLFLKQFISSTKSDKYSIVLSSRKITITNTHIYLSSTTSFRKMLLWSHFGLFEFFRKPMWRFCWWITAHKKTSEKRISFSSQPSWSEHFSGQGIIRFWRFRSSFKMWWPQSKDSTVDMLSGQTQKVRNALSQLS